MFEITYWTWFILAGVLVILEMTTPIYYFLWLGLTAATVGIISWVFPGLDVTTQLLIFGVLALVSIFFGRLYTSRTKEEDNIVINRRAEIYKGRAFVLETPIINGQGKVRLDDTSWKIEGPDTPAGSHVIVVSIKDKSILVVKPL